MRIVLLLLALGFSPLALPQTWPAKPVRVIVNVAAGGVADVTARVLGARLAETLGQGFLVENRAGGDGYIGFDAVARSDADGHVLLYSPGSSMMIAPHIVNRPDLDPRRRKMEKDEIEKAVAECKARSRMRAGALEKIRRL